MALLVEDGSGVAGAESYASVSEADAYFAARGAPTSWSSLTEAVKEQYLRESTDYLEMVYNGRWQGCRTEEEQPLSWPRYDVRDADGFWIDSATIPTRLKYAQFEAALRRATEGDLLPDVDTPGSIKAEEVVAGPVKRSVEYTGGAEQLPQYTKVVNYLRPLLKSANELRRA